ncbi:MAG: hypothetical protein IT494_06860 [Gammaproteobacteria bacterium]|nr:hypothetical protein [Gammaproteobacteria bacterium]
MLRTFVTPAVAPVAVLALVDVPDQRVPVDLARTLSFDLNILGQQPKHRTPAPTEGRAWCIAGGPQVWQQLAQGHAVQVITEAQDPTRWHDIVYPGHRPQSGKALIVQRKWQVALPEPRTIVGI